ncbi:MAG: hypothetical protein WKF89_12735 [Chitinophagaceae bacterium]
MKQVKQKAIADEQLAPYRNIVQAQGQEFAGPQTGASVSSAE